MDRGAVVVALVALLTAAGFVLAMALVASDCDVLSSDQDPCASDGSVRVRLLWGLAWVTVAAGSLVLVRSLWGASRLQTTMSGAAITAVSVPTATIIAWDGRYPESISVATVITGLAGAVFLARWRRIRSTQGDAAIRRSDHGTMNPRVEE